MCFIFKNTKKLSLRGQIQKGFITKVKVSLKVNDLGPSLVNTKYTCQNLYVNSSSLMVNVDNSDAKCEKQQMDGQTHNKVIFVSLSAECKRHKVVHV